MADDGVYIISQVSGTFRKGAGVSAYFGVLSMLELELVTYTHRLPAKILSLCSSTVEEKDMDSDTYEPLCLSICPTIRNPVK